MGASRETCNIWYYLKIKDWAQASVLIKNLLFLIKQNRIVFVKKGRITKLEIVRNYSAYSTSRKLIILDTFITPYHKKIGCRITSHKWKQGWDDPDEWYCTKCHKFVYGKPQIREEKIKSILK